MFDLKCNPAKCVGPIDERVVAHLSKRFPLDPVYLACLGRCHGGQPRSASVRLADRTYQLALFLTLVDEQTVLPGPFRPHFDVQTMDERVMNSVTAVLEFQSSTSECLFDKLMPFAATEKDMCLDRAYVDLFCFDYRTSSSTPPVVLWDANRALEASFDWNKLPTEEQFDVDGNFRSVPWSRFLVPIADSFAEFLEKLKRDSPSA